METVSLETYKISGNIEMGWIRLKSITTFRELEDMVYIVVGIECNNHIVMKFIYHSTYDLGTFDPLW